MKDEIEVFTSSEDIEMPDDIQKETNPKKEEKELTEEEIRNKVEEVIVMLSDVIEYLTEDDKEMIMGLLETTK